MPIISRRKFLTLAGLGASFTTLGFRRPVFNDIMRKKGRIAIQLWTVRDLLKEDYAKTIERIASIGYEAVETIPPPEGMSLTEAGEIIRSNGLQVCACHVELPKDGKHEWMEISEAFDCQTIVWHGWPEDQRYKSSEGISELIDTYHQANDMARSNGLRFGLHNHWWEFENGASGTFPMAILHSRLDERIFFEIDTYWAKVAGKDPAEMTRLFGDRVKMLHIKDGPARWTPNLDDDEPEPMVAVGKGSQDFPAIVEAGGDNIEWMIVEMDNCATDVMTAVEESYSYLTENNLVVRD